jgi:heptosyltransferase-1
MTFDAPSSPPPERLDRQRFLIIKPSALGDVATTLPLLCDLKRAYPQADIDWLLHPALLPLVEGHDAIHEVIPFDRKTLAAWWYKPSAFRAFRSLLQKLRARRYHLVIDAQGLFRSGFLARVTGAQIRIGFAEAREFAPLFYTKKVRLSDSGKKMVAVDRMRALLHPLDINTSQPADFRVPIRGVQGLVPGLDPGAPYIALIPGARWNTKRWPLDRYAALADHLLDNSHNIVLLGSPDEKTLCDTLQSKIKNGQGQQSKIINLAGKTSLQEMIALLARASLVIGNDSGPLHVAVALGRPIVALYGPTDPNFVGPYDQLDQVLRHEVPCHPCRRRSCSHHSCMQGLPLDLVWEKTRQSLTTLTVNQQ